jgi:hypothetical protein
MMAYPEGMLTISRQHRDELMAEAQRWSLIREARNARRSRRNSRAHHEHDAGFDDPILGVEAGTLAACGPRVVEPAR